MQKGKEMCKYRLGEEKVSLGSEQLVRLNHSLSQGCSEPHSPRNLLLQKRFGSCSEMGTESSAEQVKPPWQSLLDVKGIPQVKSHLLKDKEKRGKENGPLLFCFLVVFQLPALLYLRPFSLLCPKIHSPLNFIVPIDPSSSEFPSV